MKRNAFKGRLALFFRAFAVSMIIFLSAVSAFLGFCKAYEGIRSVGFGDERSAVEIVRGAEGYSINFFDKTVNVEVFNDLLDRLSFLVEDKTVQ